MQIDATGKSRQLTGDNNAQDFCEIIARIKGVRRPYVSCGSGAFAPASMSALRATIALAFALLALVVRAADTTPPGVLVVHSNQRPTPAAIVIEDTLRKVIPEGFQAPVEIYSEYLDIEWASATADYRAEETRFLGHKYKGRNIRAIVSSAPDALQFATEFRDLMLPGVPVVHVAMPRDLMERIGSRSDVVGKTIDLDPAPTMQLALRMHPDAKRLVIVVGAAERDRIWESRIRNAVGKLGEGLEVDYLSGLSTAELIQRLGVLPRGTVVFTPGYFSDGTGKVTVPRQAVERIAQASAAPVYGALDTFVGTGIVGGYVTPYEEQAREAGAIVVRLLKGTPPSEIAPASVAQLPMFDWRQLRRWNISESQLPADAIVRFREPTAWDKYRVQISIAAAVLLFQAALIIALLFERRSRRQTAAALDESQQQMNLAVGAARLSPWIWDTTMRNKMLTPTRWKKRPDISQEQPLPFEDVIASVHPADRESLRRAAWRAQRTGEELDVEYRVVEPDGGVRWISARGRAEGGQSMRLLGVALDITERKAADLRAAYDRNALRHMSRVSTVGQLSAAIAHQLNQPLAAILGNAEAAQKMLGRENLDLTELREICKDIISEDHRASDVIRRLSELYKRGDMKMEPIDLNELVRGTLDLLHTELVVRHVTPVTDFVPTLPKIEGGHVQLQQVVLNLVLNAADAMSNVKPEQRRLTVRTDMNGVDVRLYVIDNGSGIAPGHLNAVFDPFWSTKDGGMGMGLAICKSIVASHRGTITAANNAGGGATLCVSLPTSRYA